MESSQETHDSYDTASDDCTDTEPNISANNDQPMYTAHKIDSALRVNVVLSTTQYDQMHCLNEHDYQKNELPFGHASELQNATA